LSIDYVPDLPIARVILGGWVEKQFVGEGAVEQAQDWIASMPNPEDGRFGLDISDDYCAECGATFSREAWESSENTDQEDWFCPECGAPDEKDAA